MSRYVDWAKRKAGKRFGGSTGEGSRGGQVIGHTKSGKPIYAPRGLGKPGSSTNVQRRDVQGWTKGDHADAARQHKAMADSEFSKARTKGKLVDGMAQSPRGLIHDKAAQYHARKAGILI